MFDFSTLQTSQDAAAYFGFASYSDFGRRVFGVPDGKKYFTFEINKKRGGVRRISAPVKWLKELQSKLATDLKGVYEPPRSVHAFVDNRGVLTNSAPHLAQKLLVNFDLQDFFSAITFPRVRGVFIKTLGMGPDAATVLARLVCANGVLAQGAPTSPIISNFVCFRLDKRMLYLAKRNRCVYTRYADDISLSFDRVSRIGTEVVEGGMADPVISRKVREIVEECGFDINDKKTSIRNWRQRQVVTGIKVNEIANVSRQYVKDCRFYLHLIDHFGRETANARLSEEYVRRHRSKCVPDVEDFLRGKLIYLKGVKGQADGVYVGLAKKFNRAFGTTRMTYKEPVNVEKTLLAIEGVVYRMDKKNNSRRD